MNAVRSNPFFRLGAWVQRRLRGHALPPPMPARAEDYEIFPYGSSESIDGLGTKGPFVIIAVGQV